MRGWMRFYREEAGFVLLFLLLILLGINLSDERLCLLGVSHEVFRLLAWACGLVLAAFLLLRFGGSGWRRISSGWKDRLAELLGPSLLILLSFVMFRNLFGPGFPSTMDHTTNFLRCWLTEQGLWRQGTLLPWVSAIGAGAPLNDLYPPGGVMLCCLIRLFSLYLLPEAAAYALAVMVSWLVLVGAIYGVSRLFFGRAGALAASLLLFVDPGGVGQFGYAQCFYIAMWPMTLSGGLLTGAIGLYIRTLDRDASPRILFAMALLVTGAVLSHVFALLALALNLFVITLVRLLLERDRIELLRRSLHGLFFVMLGICLSAWWLLPFLSSSSWTDSFGATMAPPMALADMIVRCSLFANTSPILTALYLFGCVWGFLSGRRTAVSLSIAMTVNLVLMSNAMYEWLFSPAYASFFRNVPVSRFGGISKLWCLILVAGLVQAPLASCLGAVGEWHSRRFGRNTETNQTESVWTMPLFGFLIALFLILVQPIAWNLATYIHLLSVPYAIKTTAQHPPYFADIQAMMKRVVQKEAKTPGVESFFLPFTSPRIGVQDNTPESLIPYLHGFGIVSPVYMPTLVFKTRTTNLEPTSIKLSAQKYFIAYGSVVDSILNQSRLQLVDRCGMAALFEYPEYSPLLCEMPGAPDGRAELEGLEPNRLRLRLSNLEEGAWVRLPISRYRKWHAYRNGKRAPIVEHIEDGEDAAAGKYISLQAGNGVLELRYEGEGVDWLGRGLSLAGLTVLGVVGLWRKKFEALTLPLSQALKPEWVQKGPGIALIGLTAGLLLIWLIKPTPATRFWYAGQTMDPVQWSRMEKDGVLDWEFGLILGREVKGRVLQQMVLQKMEEGKAGGVVYKWNNQNSTDGKIGVVPVREPLHAWENKDEALLVRMDPPHFLRLFVSNPHFGQYVPDSTTFTITLVFQDGATMNLKCRWRP